MDRIHVGNNDKRPTESKKTKTNKHTKAEGTTIVKKVEYGRQKIKVCSRITR